MAPALGYSVRAATLPHFSHPALSDAELLIESAESAVSACTLFQPRRSRTVALHAPALLIASPDRNALRDLDEWRRAVLACNAASLSGPLASACEGAANARRFRYLPPLTTAAALKTACRNIQSVQQSLGERATFFVRNATFISARGGTWREAEFLQKVLERTGCGWLLDLTHLYANAFNFGFDPYEYLEDVLPAAGAVRLHVGGGRYEPRLGRYIASAAHAIPGPVFDLLWHALESGLGKVRGVYLARRSRLFGEDERRDLLRIREIAESVGAIA